MAVLGLENIPFNQGVQKGTCNFCNKFRLCARIYHQFLCDDCANMALQMIRHNYTVGPERP